MLEQKVYVFCKIRTKMKSCNIVSDIFVQKKRETQTDNRFAFSD